MLQQLATMNPDAPRHFANASEAARNASDSMAINLLYLWTRLRQYPSAGDTEPPPNCRTCRSGGRSWWPARNIRWCRWQPAAPRRGNAAAWAEDPDVWWDSPHRTAAAATLNTTGRKWGWAAPATWCTAAVGTAQLTTPRCLSGYHNNFTRLSDRYVYCAIVLQAASNNIM